MHGYKRAASGPCHGSQPDCLFRLRHCNCHRPQLRPSRFEEKAGALAKPFPLYLFAPWIEDALKAANPDTLK